MADDLILHNPLTDTETVKSPKDAEAFLAQGWLDVTPKDAVKPKRGAPKPDIEAGRAALGKSVTTAADEKPAKSKAPAGPEDAAS